ncbi:MAG TPA: hypothetical protein VGC90_11315 [Candidatus Limnocylindrales bacterium]
MTRLVALGVSALFLAGCSLLGIGRPQGGPYPGACASLGFPARQCAAIVARARAETSIGARVVTGVRVLAPAPDNQTRLGGFVLARVRFDYVDGTADTAEVGCKTSLGDDLACDADPQIQVFAGIDHDVPCTTEAPNGDPAGCATLPPRPNNAAIAAARPLRVAALDVPLSRTGSYEIEVGRASLPNGYLSRREFGLADLRPTTFWISGGIDLDVRPLIPGRPPIRSIYRDGFNGPEPVDVFLVFDVSETTPGAVLQIRDLVVE